MPDYLIDAGVSRFTVRAFAGGLLSGLGHNPVVAIRGFNGDARWDPAAPIQASLRLVVLAASLAVQNDVSDKDRREMERGMQEEVLEIGRYPQIIFESTAVSAVQGNGPVRVKIDGNLTLHGVTKPVTLDVEGPTGPVNGMDKKPHRGFTATTTINRKDFGLNFAMTVASGDAMIGDDVKIELDIDAAQL